MIDLSIIIPAYNEEYRIIPTLISFDEYLSKREWTYEIIVVDDGSTDNTISKVESLKNVNVSVIPSEINLGKGHAVKIGMLAAKGNIRLFSDADGSTPIEEIDKVLSPIQQNEADICMGSRYLDRKNTNKTQPLFRRIWSRFSNLIIQKILLPGIIDPHCGFKAFRYEVADEVFSKSEINGWSFDLEILALSRIMKYKLKEVSVIWVDDDRSTGKLSDIPKEIYNVYRIKRSLRKL